MDVGSTNGWNFEEVITKEQLIEKINRVYPIEPAQPRYFGEVAKLYRYVGSNAEVGFITSVSESFCSSCTRARISADGKFFTCLFGAKGTDLRTLLRENISDASLLKILNDTWRYRTIDIQMKERLRIQVNVQKLKCLTLVDSERRISYARALFKTSVVF